MTETVFGRALARQWPHASAELRAGIEASAPAVFAKYGWSPLVIAIFMGQITHECGGGRELVENLNYTPEGIVRTWPSRFKSLAEAMPFARAPQKLANKVYNGRMGNRPNSNDGWTFRGHGGTNTTGHDGFFRLAQKTALDLLNHPELVNDPANFLECAVVDFILCGCVPFAQRDDVRGVTYRLNGGYIGLAQREDLTRKWKSALMAEHGQEALFPAAEARPDGELRYGDSGGQVKGLQAQLKAKGYPCGTDDGHFHEGTRGAIAKLQLDTGLPATGHADQATRDALEQIELAPIGEARATATARDLREKGSTTIAAADRLGWLGKLLAALGLTGIGGVGTDKAGGLDLDTLQAGIDKAHQATGLVDQVRPMLKAVFASPFALPIAAACVIVAILIVREARAIARARVEDHRSGANMGR
jgi:putative chitinase